MLDYLIFDSSLSLVYIRSSWLEHVYIHWSIGIFEYFSPTGSQITCLNWWHPGTRFWLKTWIENILYSYKLLLVSLFRWVCIYVSINCYSIMGSYDNYWFHFAGGFHRATRVEVQWNLFIPLHILLTLIYSYYRNDLHVFQESYYRIEGPRNEMSNTPIETLYSVISIKFICNGKGR